MRHIIEKMGNPSRSSEEIKGGCTLFFRQGDFSDRDYEIIKDHDITLTATNKAFLTEMSSEKDNYGFFLLNKTDGNYVIYDFLVSTIDERISEEEYIAQSVCQPLFSRLVMNNAGKDVYVRISGNIDTEYLRKLNVPDMGQIFNYVAHLICTNE